MNVTFLTSPGATGLIAVDKPAGVTVIPGRDPEAGPCLRALVEQQLGRPVWVVHRVDRDTSGVVLFALDAATHREANMAFERGEVFKRYVALVEGVVPEVFQVDLPLVEARKRRMKVAPPGEGKPASTRFRLRAQYDGYALVDCEPLTGRQHQIRVHLASRGTPLAVDHQYGTTGPLRIGEATLSRTPLHAASIELLRFKAEAPMPADMQSVIDVLSAR